MMALIGAVIAVSALLSGLVERSNFPQVAVFLLLGAVLGPAGLGLLEVGLDSPVLRVVATLSLALVLFTDALSLNLPQVKKNAGLAATILGPGTLIATAGIGLASYYLLHLSAAHSAILAAALASTDPVLLRGLLRRPDLPGQTRLALQLESGLNDVVLLPIVLIAMALAVPAEGGVNVSKLLLQMLVLGPGAGALVAAIAIGTLELVRRRVGIRRDYESIYSLGVCLAAYAAAESLHGSGFLAAFAAGLTISALDVELCDCFQEYGETTAEMLLMFTFVLMGGSLIWSGLPLLGATFGVFVLIALAARPLSLLGTLKPLKIDPRSRAIIAWFGPRGLSTLLLVLVPVFAGVPDSEPLFKISSVIVLFSVAIHGLSIMFFGKGAFRHLHAKGVHTHPATAKPAQPVAAAPVMATAELEAPSATAESETISPAEVASLIARGERVHLLDVRSTRGFLNSEEVLEGSSRVDPERPKKVVNELAIPKEDWLALYCACPSEQTSLRATKELRQAGWTRAVAVVGGWDALVEQGFPTVPKSPDLATGDIR